MSIWQAIVDERARQEALWGGEHAWGHGSCASPELPATVKLAVLCEETGEVSRAVLERDLYWFWRVVDHGEPKGIARTEKERDRIGRLKPCDPHRWVFCEEHKDFELSRRRITAAEALEYVLSLEKGSS